MSTEPGHSNSETHMTMDGKPDARFKEVGLSSLPSLPLLDFSTRPPLCNQLVKLPLDPQLTDRMAVVSTETKVAERPGSRRLVMELHPWSPRVQARTPVLTSMSTAHLYWSTQRLTNRPSAHGGKTQDGGQDDRKLHPFIA